MTRITPTLPNIAPCCVEPWGCEHDRAMAEQARLLERVGWPPAQSEAEPWELVADREPDPLDALPEDHGGQLPADVLSAMSPDAALAAVLQDLPAADADDELVIEIVAAYKRMEAWAAAQAAKAAAELARRPASNPSWARAGEWEAVNVAGEELAMRLGLTRHQAEELIDVGHRAFGRGSLTPTGEALETGRLDWRKTCTIVRTLRVHPDPVAWAVQDDLVDDAGLRTHNQLVRDLSRALIAVDPEEADARHRRAARTRHVSRPRPLPDGMASITAVLPATDAVALDLALHGAAQAARAAGDDRTLDQLRADALTTMATTALASGRIGPLDASVPAPDLHDLPGIRGCGPMPLPATTNGRVQVRITVPLSVALPPQEPPDPPPDAAAGPGRAPSPVPDEPSAEVAELQGYGPLPPEVARALALGGTWRRLVTDERQGTVLDVGRTRYRPPEDLARYVRERDRTCTRPGCTTPASQCDLDHLVPWASGGTTSADNLQPLCARDHRVKSSGAFKVWQTSPGVFEWETPGGKCYRREVTGVVRHLGVVYHLGPR